MEKPRFEMTFELNIRCAIRDESGEVLMEQSFCYEKNDARELDPEDARVYANDEMCRETLEWQAIDEIKRWVECGVSNELAHDWE